MTIVLGATCLRRPRTSRRITYTPFLQPPIPLATLPFSFRMTHLKVRRSFKGHIGHLTPDQEQALEVFKVNLDKAGLWTPATETTRASHDDVTLVYVH